MGAGVPSLIWKGIVVIWKCLPFRMLNLSTLFMSIRQGDWLTIVDIPVAYFHIPIHRDRRKNLHFFLSRQHLRVQVSSLWPVSGSSNFYQVHGCITYSCLSAGNSHHELHGQLAVMCPNQTTSEEQYRGCVVAPSQSRLDVEQGEELPYSMQNGIVSGLGSWLNDHESLS